MYAVYVEFGSIAPNRFPDIPCNAAEVAVLVLDAYPPPPKSWLANGTPPRPPASPMCLI